MFQVFSPETERYLESERIELEVSEPYNHDRGTPTVERAGRSVKELTRMAVNYVLLNPNVKSFGFNEKVILVRVWSLWSRVLKQRKLQFCRSLRGNNRRSQSVSRQIVIRRCIRTLLQLGEKDSGIEDQESQMKVLYESFIIQ